MTEQSIRLWPYSTRAALIAAPLIWIILGISAMALKNRLGISQLSGRSVLLALGVGLIPVVLLTFDNLVRSRGVIDVKGVKLDFSQGQITKPAAELPDNIGKPEAAVSDSSPMEILSTLEAAVESRIVRLDIGEGNAWWVSRLLALCAGATRVGSPKAIVFVGRRQNADYAFLGYATAERLLAAITEENEIRGEPPTTYGALYRKARWLARQVVFFARPEEPPPIPFLPPNAAPLPLDTEVQRYFPHPRGTSLTKKYVELGEAAFEQILMDQIGLYKLENIPDRLTLGRLEQLFAHCLYRDTVDVQLPKEQQLEAFLESSAPYVALVSGGEYQGLMERDQVNDVLLRQLLSPLETGK